MARLHHPKVERYRQLVTDNWWPIAGRHSRRELGLFFLIDTALTRIHFTRTLNISGGLFGFTEPHSQFLALAESAARNMLMCSPLPQPDIFNHYPHLESMLEGQADIDDPGANTLAAAQAFLLLPGFLTHPLAYPFTQHTRYSRIRRRYYEKRNTRYQPLSV